MPARKYKGIQNPKPCTLAYVYYSFMYAYIEVFSSCLWIVCLSPSYRLFLSFPTPQVFISYITEVFRTFFLLCSYFQDFEIFVGNAFLVLMANDEVAAVLAC